MAIIQNNFNFNFKNEKLEDLHLFNTSLVSPHLCLSQNEQLIIAIGDYNILKIYQIKLKQQLLIVQCRCEVPIEIRCDENLGLIITAWNCNSIMVHQYEIGCRKLLRNLMFYTDQKHQYISQLNKKLKQFAVSGEDNHLYIYQYSTFQKCKEMQKITTEYSIQHLQMCEINNQLIGSINKDVLIYQYKPEQQIYALIQTIKNNKVSYLSQLILSQNRLIVTDSRCQLQTYIFQNKFIKQGKLSKDKSLSFPKYQLLTDGNTMLEYGLFSKELNIWIYDEEEWKQSQSWKLNQNINQAIMMKNNKILIVLSGKIAIFQ